MIESTQTPTAPNAATSRLYALIPCAGNGSRAGTVQPKQYQEIAGLPMVLHTLAAFAGVTRITECLVVVAPGDGFLTLDDPRTVVAPCGGPTRADSVLNGLERLLAHGAQVHDWVLVHDAARCLVTPAQIDALIDACGADAVGGLLALPLADTLKAGEGDRVAGTVDRAGKWLAQTPQMFRIGTLADALRQGLARDAGAITDESSAMEAMGLQPKLVRGAAQNFKVTYPEDFALAEAILRNRK